jgi:hypothetical protein
LVIREVLIPTEDEAGKGDDFVFPSNPDYNNSIHAIFDKSALSGCFKFEAKDGAISVHPHSTHRFKRKEISPKDAPITKIQVWHYSDFICGFKFYSNDKLVSEAGDFDAEMREVKLEAGERLVGVKSKLYDNTPGYTTHHCNLVLMIGRLE